MATHSSVLTWEITWIEAPGRLQSTGSQGIRHNSATEQQWQQGVWWDGGGLWILGKRTMPCLFL